MNIGEALKSLELKFTSGNVIEVERATITREEFEAIKEGITHLQEIEWQYEDLK